MPQRFVCRFAAGENSTALSAVWRIWAGKRKPDLYIVVEAIGMLKASIHCPRPDRPTWKRHWGFASDTKSAFAAEVLAARPNRHTATWQGVALPHGITLECRILVPGSALRANSSQITDEVNILVPPTANQWLQVAVFLGPPMTNFTGHPRMSDADTRLIAAGELSDGRPVWVVSCYVPDHVINLSPMDPQRSRSFGSREKVVAALSRVRALAVSNFQDGSLCLIDTLVARENAGAHLGSRTREVTS